MQNKNEGDCMRLTVVLLAAVVSSPAMAVPIVYDLEWADRPDRPGGTGMFIWHDDSQRITNFMWDFDGRVGGFYDTLWTDTPMGEGMPSLSVQVFELLAQEDVAPNWDCTMTGGPACIISRVFIPEHTYGWPYSTPGGFVGEMSGGLLIPAFYFVESFADFSRTLGGLVTVTRRHSVPEPATLSLFGAGLAALLWRRRRRAN